MVAVQTDRLTDRQISWPGPGSAGSWLGAGWVAIGLCLVTLVVPYKYHFGSNFYFKMEEVLIVSSSRDPAIHILDLNGHPVTSAFKNNLSESNAICFVGHRHSGSGSHDYVVSCQKVSV